MTTRMAWRLSVARRWWHRNEVWRWIASLLGAPAILFAAYILWLAVHAMGAK